MQTLIRFALENRLLVVVISLAMLIGGYFAYRTLPVDAYPDISPALVQVFAETEGLAHAPADHGALSSIHVGAMPWPKPSGMTIGVRSPST